VADPGHGTSRFPFIRPSPPARPRHFIWFTPTLGLLLCGYLFFSKSFAYLHIPGTPLFIGEVVLGIGVVEVLMVRSPWRNLLATAPVLKVLAVFMAVCSVRLARDLPVYQLDAIRDSSIWYYGIFAFLVAAAALREPTFVPRLLRWYRQVLPWYFLWAPFAIVLAQVDGLAGISVPGTDTPINSFRFNDIAVHLGLGLAFLWLGLDRLVEGHRQRGRDAWLSILGVLALLVAASQSRGGFLAALATGAIAFAYLPAGRRRRLVFSVTGGLLVVLTLVWALDLRLQGERRDVSLQQLTDNVASIAGSTENEELSGTVQWREGFWEQVLNDLLSSQAWLNGIGFGPILPERYEVDVGNTNNDSNAQPLRSVHNSHLTILARVGFPGFGLWILLWLTLGMQLFLWVRRRPGGVRDPNTALGVWYLAGVVGFLIGAYFDPSLEGPHAGIWLFTLVGLAAAHSRVAARARPEAAGAVRWPTAVPARLAALSPAALWAHARHLTGRLGWGVADQAMSSLTNFGVSIYVARTLGTVEFGAFSLAFATYLIVLAASRGLATDALAVRYSGVELGQWRRAVASASGTAATVGLIAGAGCVIAGLWFGQSTGAALLGLGLTLPGLLLQDSWRFAFFSAGKGRLAFVNDLVWALALVPAMLIMVVSGRSTVGWFMLAWGGSAGFAAVVGAFQARLVPRPTEAVHWLRQHRDLALRYLGESLSLSSASQIRLYGLAAIAGLAAAGSLRAAELLLGPLNTAIMGIAMMAVPEAAVLLRRSLRRLQPFCLLLSCLGAGGAIVWGMILLLLPDSVGQQILHSAWYPASALLVPVTLAVAGFGFSIGAWAGVRALGAASRSLRAQVIGSVVYLTGAFGGTVVGGAAGAAWGSAAGTLIGAGVWWWELHQGVRDAESEKRDAEPAELDIEPLGLG
jgi:O-Antigen ligase